MIVIDQKPENRQMKLKRTSPATQLHASAAHPLLPPHPRTHVRAPYLGVQFAFRFRIGEV